MSVTNSSYHEVKVDIAVFQNLPIATNDAIDFFGNQYLGLLSPILLHQNVTVHFLQINVPVKNVTIKDKDRKAVVFHKPVQY